MNNIPQTSKIKSEVYKIQKKKKKTSEHRDAFLSLIEGTRIFQQNTDSTQRMAIILIL